MSKRRYRTSAEWQTLIEQQQTSGLNGAAFCKQHRLCRKTFYARRKVLTEKTVVTQLPAGQFIQIKPKPVQSGVMLAGAVLHHRENRLHLPPDIDSNWVADLMKALS